LRGIEKLDQKNDRPIGDGAAWIDLKFGDFLPFPCDFTPSIAFKIS
jgi:hypothetical protein